ncbi:hypothetical protein A3A60_03290 [Candidatus Curtissbacteria bacterium RIFCSPLOWO2_01_FULL_42_26]|uniref:Uncharacterized protein n=1 Tax=Candidatus Curtissbacteria bacterium RIFCSPLOWO2_01_FULL_42_26 TaxID=1797729 RepID=A0A1F5I3V9_9BACT|nr:MAG: hypothetical protein A3A60_03290 [Candidatus Curtissbacteria bacterium RIFCSPLOWO2_01_FULL_42_26]
MPAKSTKKRLPITSILSRVSSATKSLSGEKNKADKKPFLVKLIKILAAIYLVIWILIGIFFLIFIYGNWKQGAFKELLAKPQPVPQQQTQAPVETNLPGVGMVNINCVQSSLSTDAIQKLVQSGDTSKLTDDEKAKLEPCIIQKEEAAPSTSPSPSK